MKIKKPSAALFSILFLLLFIFKVDVFVYANDLERVFSNSNNMSNFVCSEVNNDVNNIETAKEKVNSDFIRDSEILSTLSDSQVQTYSGYLTEENNVAYIIKPLQPGEILNASLICPLSPSLDYDLLLCECNTTTYEVGEVLASSTLYTHFDTYLDGINKTANESLSYVNKNDEIKYYYIIIFSKQGYSSIYKFNLSISISEKGTYGTEEPNDSVYYPTTISTSTINGLNLHAKNDNDWFKYTAVEDVPSINIDTGVDGYEANVYLTNGQSLFLVYPDKEGIYDLTAGYTYFIHVYSTMDDFVPKTYNLNITPKNIVINSINVIDFTGDMGSEMATYSQGTLYRFKKEFTITVKVQTKNGYGVPNQEVYLLWKSGSWTEESGNDHRGTKATTDDNGIAEITLSSLPVGVGSYSYSLSGPKYFTHYYDLDHIIINTGDYSASMKVYHFAYSIYNGG